MPTKKKKTTAKKSPVKAVKKAAPKKAPARKTSPKKSKPAGPREQKAASAALKLVDEAAALLRKGIRTSADTTEKTRHEAKQKAHALLNKASSSLGDLLSGSTSVLRSAINKI